MDEDKPYSICEEILLNCLICDEISLNERKNIAQQIIEGKKKLVGINEFDDEFSALKSELFTFAPGILSLRILDIVRW